MSQVKHNVIANFIGNVWVSALSIGLVPVYVHFMGIESFGLVGIFALLQGIFNVFDLGLSSTLNRELAAASAKGAAQEMADLVRTLEWVYWLVAGAIAIVTVSSSPFIARHWLNNSTLSNHVVIGALILSGLVIAVRWPYSLYSGGLLGLQKQGLFNRDKIVLETIRSAGVVIILAYVSSTIYAFFLWQMVISVLTTLLFRWTLWQNLPPIQGRASFRSSVFKKTWRFAAGMNGIAIMATILMQTDKVILSRMLSLESFGYYTLAATVATGLYQFSGPFYNALYPKFTQLVAIGDTNQLKLLYHKSCQLLSVLVIPVALMISFFSKDILALWTRSATTAAVTATVLSIMVLGTALNCLVTIPFALQLAYSWPTLTFYSNIVGVIVLVPAIFILTHYYGAVGAALAWLALNTGYFFVVINVMHRRLLQDEKWAWYLVDIGKPFVITLTIMGAGKYALTMSALNGAPLFFALATLLSVTVFATAASTRSVRTMGIKWLGKGSV